MKTVAPKAGEIKQDWYLIDAEDQVLGRLATRIASLLRGKHKPIFSPHLDVGDYVIVINADKIKLTGSKELQKIYKRYSGYPDGLKEIPFKKMQEHNPEHIIIHAVKGMLPKNILGRKLIQKLKVYPGNDHPHIAQQPQSLDLNK
ncbi:MAG: 50S ribosomal protein L13 [Candidatus Cloacimonetes bacterium]|nr:50S ribosomal protein L13 [Candidatus Cloacimonadota bacterium]